MSSPSELFCRILETQLNSAINAVEDALLLSSPPPLKTLRDVKSNINRVNNLIFPYIESEILRLEKLIIDTLFLDKVNQLEGIDNFCQVAFSCEILVETLVENSSTYLPFLDATTISLLSTNYPLFERHICVLGLRNIITTFTDSILDEIETTLNTLNTMLFDNLRIAEFLQRYEDALEDSGVLTAIEQLRKFLNCGFGVCGSFWFVCRRYGCSRIFCVESV